MLENGRFRSIAEIAEAEKIGRSFVSRLLNLTLLAPDIQEAIPDDCQPKGVQLEELTRAMLGAWGEQREAAKAEEEGEPRSTFTQQLALQPRHAAAS